MIKKGTKYYPLYEHLLALGRESDQFQLTLDEIEQTLGRPLPRSAEVQRAWWSNRRTGGVQASAWLDAGFHTETIDLTGRVITFHRPAVAYHVTRSDGEYIWDQHSIRALRRYLDMSQAEFAERLGVRQPTISEWETGAYEPKRSTNKYLTTVAEDSGFDYST